MATKGRQDDMPTLKGQLEWQYECRKSTIEARTIAFLLKRYQHRRGGISEDPAFVETESLGHCVVCDHGVSIPPTNASKAEKI